MDEFKEFEKAIEKLTERKYVYRYESKIDDNGIRWLHIHMGHWYTGDDVNGDPYKTARKIESEAEKRGFYYESNLVYGSCKVYEKSPIDVF